MENLPIAKVDRDETLAFYRAAVASGEINQPETVLNRYIDEKLKPSLGAETAEGIKAETRKFMSEHQTLTNRHGGLDVAMVGLLILIFFIPDTPPGTSGTSSKKA